MRLTIIFLMVLTACGLYWVSRGRIDASLGARPRDRQPAIVPGLLCDHLFPS